MERNEKSEPDHLLALQRKLDQFEFSFPIMTNLSDFLSTSNALAGKKIGWHCHLTALTALSAKVILKAGATLFMSECNSATTDSSSVEYMRSLGAEIYLGESSAVKVLQCDPEIISDTGFVLSSAFAVSITPVKSIRAACEITTSGIMKLRAQAQLPFPVININDGQLKSLIENFHGVGDGVIDALFQLTGRLWSGRTAAVVGYGRVGAGVAEYLKRTGASVTVIENDSVRSLLAHYDGFVLTNLADALGCCELVVCATGARSVISLAEFKLCRDGIILMNVGHWDDEIDVETLKKESVSSRNIVEHLDEYSVPVSDSRPKRILLAGGAGPANVVMLSGSAEPTLVHLVTEILTMHYMLSEGVFALKPGENPMPPQIEQQAARLALQTLQLDKKCI